MAGLTSFRWYSVVTVVVFAAVESCSTAVADDVEFFEKKIRPLLVEHCYDCHGPDEAEGELRLDSKAGWQRGGQSGPAIVPNQPAASLLMRAVRWQDDSLKMPPEEIGQLSDSQIADLRHWIRHGATDPRDGKHVVSKIDAAAKSHWAFQPVRAPKVPNGKHPVDWLIEKQLQSEGFQPVGRAPLSTRIRRATFDLLGLPPTTEQIETGERDFDQLIRELLASPRYGERWGRHWLDVARYSDAKDGVLMYGDARIRPFAYTYRDYVIRAFNDDKPFNQFVKEQIAADQLALADDAPELAALGLLTLGRMFDRNRHDVIDDQIDVISRGFLGLTVSCARCHDHKFDPVPTADYYSLYGVFASTVEPLKRPRIESVGEKGKPYEDEIASKFDEVFAQRRTHYDAVIRTAQQRTADYLETVATTEPDIAETTIFFLSLIPDQLKPQITWRWRQLVAARSFPDDPVFGPWHDLMQLPQPWPTDAVTSRLKVWKSRGINARILAALENNTPQNPGELGRTYGDAIFAPLQRQFQLRADIQRTQSQLETAAGTAIRLADIVGGGNGLGSGERGAGINPANGKKTTGQASFVEIPKHDVLIPVETNPFIDGIFMPKSKTATISSTGLQVHDLTPSAGMTWDFFKYGPSSGFSTTTIDETNYATAPHDMLSMHANKGLTFDLSALRKEHSFTAAKLQGVFGHAGEKGKSRLQFGVYLDGRRTLWLDKFAAQQAGHHLNLVIPANVRFLTFVVLEGTDGIAHDQAILGNPRLIPAYTAESQKQRNAQVAALKKTLAETKRKLVHAEETAHGDPLTQLLTARESPVWFPERNVDRYLPRQKADAFRGLVGQVDAISVRHKDAAARAMVLLDSEQIYNPVIFRRGDPTQRGAPVPRRFLKVLSPKSRAEFANGSGRVNLARSIASDTNPLTARVWVNRVWMHHFGEPLVENPADFGLRTPRPVQAELLDYLASFFVRSGWRTKPLHELILLSDAWQRTSVLPETTTMKRQAERDPGNQFLWRANRRRLDFEQMRDTMLAVSGQLNTQMFGRPFIITNLDDTRRTVYGFVERQNIPSVIKTFDVANADTSTSRRTTTTVPQQALFAMNSPFIARAAQKLADRAAGESTQEKIDNLFELALQRTPRDDERDLAEKFLAANSLAEFAQVLLMSNELMFID